MVRVDEQARRGPSALRIGVVLLLVIGALFAALPWIGCSLLVPFWRPDLDSMRICVVGLGPPDGPFGSLSRAGYGLPGFAGPYWGNLLVGIAYLVAAGYVAFTKRRF